MGALPHCLRQLPTLRGAGATPLATPCCLPSSVTLSLGRSSPERAFLAYLSTKDFPQSLQRKRPTPARVFPFFLTSIEPQAGQQQSVFSCVSGVSESVSGLVTDTLFRPLDTLKRQAPTRRATSGTNRWLSLKICATLNKSQGTG